MGQDRRGGLLIYRALFGLVLKRLDAERAHALGTRLLRWAPLLARSPGVREPDPVLRTRVLGLELSSPLVLAAGFDKDAEHVDGLLALGFGAVEVGTVTAQPQDGNPRPRLFRLPADRALVNRMGFNNAGAVAVAARLAARRRRGHGGVVGVNIGKTKVVTPEAAAEDYRESARHLAPLADYLVINVSSPNTPGLRDLQSVGQLGRLITAVREAADAAGRPDLPLLVKIAPDLADADIDAIADLALERGLQGIVATNTTISRDGLRSSAGEIARAGAGGLSGAPLCDRSVAVLQRLRDRVGDRLVLVSAGGVQSAEDVLARLAAGASLVQAYTGFVYGGPLWARRVNAELAGLLRALGARSPAAVLGTDVFRGT